MSPVEMWLGISLDEIERMKLSNYHRITYRYPLIDERITREDCKRYLEDKDFMNVKKSSCVFCPYHSNQQWKEIKSNYPEEWKKVLKVDNKIRDLTKKGIKDKLYLHSSRKPIEEAYLQEDQEELFMCEEGYCGI
jgi:hypothetical protein